MAEFASTAGFADCWCKCRADRHRLELAGGRLVHTRCKGCGCVQYEPRIEEPAPVDEDLVLVDERGDAERTAIVEEDAAESRSLRAEEEAEHSDELALMREAGLTYRPDQTIALVDAEDPPDAVSLPPPSGVLSAWRSWVCLTCGNRRYEWFECCTVPATPVTLTMTRGHGG